MKGAELKSARKDLGLTQAELGRELGISRVAVGLMERGGTIDRRTELAMRYLVAKLGNTKTVSLGRFELPAGPKKKP